VNTTEFKKLPVEERIQLQRTAVESTGLWQCCLNCSHWAQKCLKYNAMPPAETIVLSCIDWEDDIPF